MLINELAKLTSLTKKAIEYYSEQDLVSPVVLENGYRDFSENDVERLKKVYVLRRLELSIDEIKLVLDDKTGGVLPKISVQKELYLQREQARKSLLDKLDGGKSYTEISLELKSLEQSANITDKLLEAFPGYYGRFICLHFAGFLNEPIITEEQQTAYQEIISFLDNVPTFDIPKELQELLDENTKHISTKAINAITDNMKKSVENPDQFLSENKEMLEEYLAYKQSEEYKNSSASKMQQLLKDFNKTSGYYDIFIPAMKKLSGSYAEYMKKMDAANKVMMSKYPEFAKLTTQ